MIKKIDRFSNIIFELTGVKQFDILGSIPSNFNNAVLLKNCNKSIIDEYNSKICSDAVDNSKIATLQHVSPTGNTYLIKNSSNCPQLVNSEIRAAGVSIIYLHNSCYYVLLANDKTKKYLSVPGGTACLDDFNKNSCMSKIAFRELKEETSGTVLSHNSELKSQYNKNISGISENELRDIKKICEFNFNTKFFDIDVNDIYTMYGAISSSKSIFGTTLFNDNCLVSNNNSKYYKLKYENHQEIDNMYALQLANVNDLDNDVIISKKCDEYMEKITNSDLYIKHSHPVTYLHIYMSYVNLFRFIYPNNGYLKISEFNKNFPTNLLKYTVF